MGDAPSSRPRSAGLAAAGGPSSARSDLWRTLTAISELGLRFGWLLDRATNVPLPVFAEELDVLASGAPAGFASPRAEDAFLTVCLFLSTQHGTALNLSLRLCAQKQDLSALSRLLRPGTDPEALETNPKVPTFGGRELSLGERRSRARRPSASDLEKLLLDPAPLVLTQLFECARLTEDDVVRLIARRPARLVAHETILRSMRWITRLGVRRALVMNPGAPHAIALPLLPTLPAADWQEVAQGPSPNPVLREVAAEWLALKRAAALAQS